MAARIKDVASKAGVSTATVSHVINGTRYVSDEVKKRVHDAMKQLNYSPNFVARSLRSRKSNIIGLIVPYKMNDNSNHFFMTVANGIENVLKKNGYHLILSNSAEDYAEELNRIQMFNNQWIDGLIIAPTSPTPSADGDAVEDRQFGDYPVVFIDRKPKILTGDCVLVNALEGSFQAVKALLDKGHTRIGFLSGKINVTSVESRLLGYMKALKEHGIEQDNSLILTGSTKWESGYELTKQLLDSNPDITALFIANNVISVGALKYLREKDIKIPEQMALIVFDNFEWTGMIDPPLSVVHQPAFELGEKAAEVLLSRIKNPKKKIKEYLLPAQLIIRDSF